MINACSEKNLLPEFFWMLPINSLRWKKLPYFIPRIKLHALENGGVSEKYATFYAPACVNISCKVQRVRKRVAHEGPAANSHKRRLRCTRTPRNKHYRVRNGIIPGLWNIHGLPTKEHHQKNSWSFFSGFTFVSACFKVLTKYKGISW